MLCPSCEAFLLAVVASRVEIFSEHPHTNTQSDVKLFAEMFAVMSNMAVSHKYNCNEDFSCGCFACLKFNRG